MLGQLCYSIIDARIPQEPPLIVADEIAVPGKADGHSDVGSWCPTRLVGATAVAAVDHIEAVDCASEFGIGSGRNSHARDGSYQRQDGYQNCAAGVCLHETLHSKYPFVEADRWRL
jgi:hypothetical protein